MNCPKCKEAMLTEAVAPNKVKVTCQKCGLSEVRDTQGRKLLTEADPEQPSAGRMLLG